MGWDLCITKKTGLALSQQLGSRSMGSVDKRMTGLESVYIHVKLVGPWVGLFLHCPIFWVEMITWWNCVIIIWFQSSPSFALFTFGAYLIISAYSCIHFKLEYVRYKIVYLFIYLTAITREVVTQRWAIQALVHTWFYVPSIPTETFSCF